MDLHSIAGFLWRFGGTLGEKTFLVKWVFKEFCLSFLKISLSFWGKNPEFRVIFWPDDAFLVKMGGKLFYLKVEMAKKDFEIFRIYEFLEKFPWVFQKISLSSEFFGLKFWDLHITFPEFQLMISLLSKKKHTIGILVTQWFQFSTQFSSPWLCQLQQELSHCHLFCLFLYDGDDSRTDLVFVIGIFCFLILNTPKLGWLYNIHSTINNKGCLDLKDIQGNGEVVGYQGEQNWDEIWNLWVTRIPMVCFFFLSSEIVSWNSENGMWLFSKHCKKPVSYSCQYLGEAYTHGQVLGSR